MTIKVKVSCPTCDKQIGGNDNSPSYYYQEFDDMVELFGITRKGKSYKQCKECFESAKEYQISDVDREMAISCIMKVRPSPTQNMI